MKILLLGATGRLGRNILNELLAKNIEVTVLVRDDKFIKTTNKNLNIVVGTPENKKNIDESLVGCTAVITTLNISRKSDFPWSSLRTPKNLLSNTMEYLIELLDNHKIDRLITISAWGANESKRELPWWFSWVIDNSNIKYGYIDHERQEAKLKETDLKWSIIRPVGLTYGNKNKIVKVSVGGIPKPNLLISRSSLAVFVVKTLVDNIYCQETITVFN